MQETLFSIHESLPLPSMHPQAPAQTSSTSATTPFDKLEDMSVTLNTAFVRTRMPSSERNLAVELDAISKTPAYQSIMSAAQQLALSQNISELEAAEQIICTFRKMDELWQAYLLQEGMAQLTN